LCQKKFNNQTYSLVLLSTVKPSDFMKYTEFVKYSAQKKLQPESGTITQFYNPSHSGGMGGHDGVCLLS
jgi:hypothetical protein